MNALRRQPNGMRIARRSGSVRRRKGHIRSRGATPRDRDGEVVSLDLDRHRGRAVREPHEIVEQSEHMVGVAQDVIRFTRRRYHESGGGGGEAAAPGSSVAPKARNRS